MSSAVTLLLILIYGCNTTESQSPYPEKLITQGPANGTLLIIGGSASDQFFLKFMDLVGGKDEPIVVIPTAASSEEFSEEFLENYKGRFTRHGFTNVTVLHTRDRDEANSDKFIEPINEASGVWFSGGRQWRHADSYLNTKSHEAFNNLLDRGGVIAGSSAGATIQGSYLARGDTKANTIMMGDHEEGLGFLSNVAIDQHLFARNRQFDLFEILDNKKGLLGLGLDEDTGIIVRGNKFEVIGESYVAIYDQTRWSRERDTIYQLPQGSREFYMLKEGDEYDLVNRRVITFSNREFISLGSDRLKKYEGIYEMQESDLALEIRIENDSLTVLHRWNDYEYKIIPESEDRFYIENSDLKFDFIIDEDQKVISLNGLRGGALWTKVRD